MVSNRKRRLQIICSVLIFLAVAVMPLEGIGGSFAQAAEPSSRQEAPRQPALEEPLPPNTIENYTLAVGKVGGATLTYSISDRQMAAGVGAAHIGEASS